MAYLKGLNVSGSEVLQASQSIFTSVTASEFSGSFIGDGSGLTGVTVTGGVNLVGDQSIAGSKSFQDQLTVDDLISGSSLDISGNTTLGTSATDTTDITGVITITGDSTVTGDIDVTGNISATSAELTDVTITSLTTNTTSYQTLVMNGNQVERRDLSPTAFDNDGVVSGSQQILENLVSEDLVVENLTVTGTKTELQVTELNVQDKNITVASGSADAATANGAGLTVDGASATLTYASTGDKWVFNKALDVAGNISGSVIEGDRLKLTDLQENTALTDALVIESDGSVKTRPISTANFTAAGISGSLGDNATLIRSLTAAGISGSFTSVSASLAADITSNAFPGFGTTAGTALEGDTSLLQIGTTATTALAGDTSLFDGDYDSLSNKPSLLQIGTTATTALAGDTSLFDGDYDSLSNKPTLLQVGTGATDALAGNTSLLQIGTTAGTALAGDTVIPTQYSDSRVLTYIDSLAVLSGSATQVRTFLNVADGATNLQIGTTAGTALAGNTSIPANPAITTDGNDPSLATGITGAEIRTLIGAGTGTSNFDGAYASLSGKPTLLQVGTGATDALAGNTSLFDGDYDSLSNKPSLLQLGITATTALAGNTSIPDNPAITTNGSSPSLASGITATEVRTLIGAGTGNGSSNFDGAYASLSGKPTLLQVGTGATDALAGNTAIPANPAITTDGSDPALATGITGAEIRTLIGAGTGTSNFDGAYSSLSGLPTLLSVGTGATDALAGNTAIPANPAITTDGSDPALATGITGAEIRSLIGAGTGNGSSNFDGAYASLSGKPTLLQVGTGATDALAGNTSLLQIGTTATTALAGNTAIPANPAITTDGNTPSLASNITATEIRTLIGAGTGNGSSNFDGAYSSLSGLPTLLSVGTGATDALAGNTSIPDNPAITTNGATPSLASGITGAEIRSLIGAGTGNGSSNFDGAYASLSGTPTIPSNPAISTDGSVPSLASGITGAEIRSLIGAGTGNGSSNFDGAYASLSGKPTLLQVGTGATDALAGNTAIPANPAITTNGATPSLASGITGAEIRSLIGAGTGNGSSNFDGAYASLSGTPTIPANPAITTNGATPSLASGITAAEVRTLIGAGTGNGSSNFDGAYASLSGTPTIPANPAITTNGSSPSLASGITAAEVRTLIGAGTGTSNFNGAYSSLSGTPTIPANPAITTNGSSPSLASGITAAEVRTLIGAGTGNGGGDITAVTAGTNLSGGGTSGGVTLNVVAEPSFTDVTITSDARTKKDVNTIENALDKVNSLRGVEFTRIKDEKRSIGVIAQELEEILPELVKTDDKGMKSVNYSQITGVLIEAVKELTKEIEVLKRK